MMVQQSCRCRTADDSGFSGAMTRRCIILIVVDDVRRHHHHHRHHIVITSSSHRHHHRRHHHHDRHHQQYQQHRPRRGRYHHCYHHQHQCRILRISRSRIIIVMVCVVLDSVQNRMGPCLAAQHSYSSLSFSSRLVELNFTKKQDLLNTPSLKSDLVGTPYLASFVHSGNACSRVVAAGSWCNAQLASCPVHPRPGLRAKVRRSPVMFRRTVQ